MNKSFQKTNKEWLIRNITFTWFNNVIKIKINFPLAKEVKVLISNNKLQIDFNRDKTWYRPWPNHFRKNAKLPVDLICDKRYIPSGPIRHCNAAWDEKYSTAVQLAMQVGSHRSPYSFTKHDGYLKTYLVYHYILNNRVTKRAMEML